MARGDPLQLVLDLLDAADDAEVVLGLDELDEAEALALDDLALAARDEPVDLVARALGARLVVVGAAAASGASSVRDLLGRHAARSASASLRARASASLLPSPRSSLRKRTRSASSAAAPAAAAAGWPGSAAPAARR